MNKLGHKQTVVLGTVVIMMILAIFIALPTNVPSLDSMDGEAVFWGCTSFGIPPENWDTWTWYSDNQPNMYDWLMVLLQERETRHDGILENLHPVPVFGGIGNLDIDHDPETDGYITISGFLQYGVYPDKEDAMQLNGVPDSSNSTMQYYSSLETIMQMPGMTNIIMERLEDYPLPELHGTLRGRDVLIVVKSFLADGTTSNEEVTVRTGSDGFFTATVKPDSETLYYTIVASVKSEVITPKQDKKPWYKSGQSFPQVKPDVTSVKIPVQFYFSTETRYTTYEGNHGGFVFGHGNGQWLLPVIFVCGLVCIFLLYVRKRVVFSTVTGIEEFSPDYELLAPEKEIRFLGGDTDLIRIEFPGIEDDVPAVWGVHDPLDVVVTIKGKNCEKIEVDWKDGTNEYLLPDQKYTVQVIHVYANKGEYAVSAGYTGKSEKTVSTWRIVRIVDYREEMVNLFSGFLGSHNLETIRVAKDMTPREIERVIGNVSSSIPRSEIKTVVNGFEEANYSTHPVNRDSYLRMFRAIRIIEAVNERYPSGE